VSGDSDRELAREIMADARKVIRANQQDEIRKVAVEIDFPSITILDSGWTLQSWPMTGKWVARTPEGKIFDVDDPDGPDFRDREKFHQIDLRWIAAMSELRGEG
jgi:hypothetical protein